MSGLAPKQDEIGSEAAPEPRPRTRARPDDLPLGQVGAHSISKPLARNLLPPPFMGDRLLLLPTFNNIFQTTDSSSVAVPKALSINHRTAEGGADSNCHEESNNVVADVGSPENGLTIVCHPQDFELPRAVQSKLDADIQQANAFAVTTALFAGALISLVQLEANEQSTTPSWQALRFFTYTAIVINLTGTTLALVLIKLCSDLECIARQMIITSPLSLPARIMRGEKIPTNLLVRQYELLEQCGMSQGYKILDFSASLWITSGNVFTLVSVVMWTWLVEDKAVAGATMIGIVPSVLGLAYAFALTRR